LSFPTIFVGSDPNSIMVWDPIQQIWLEMTIIEDENEEGGV